MSTHTTTRKPARNLILLATPWRSPSLAGESRCRRRAGPRQPLRILGARPRDRKSTRLNSSHITSSYAVFCLKKKKKTYKRIIKKKTKKKKKKKKKKKSKP